MLAWQNMTNNKRFGSERLNLVKWWTRLRCCINNGMWYEKGRKPLLCGILAGSYFGLLFLSLSLIFTVEREQGQRVYGRDMQQMARSKEWKSPCGIHSRPTMHLKLSAIYETGGAQRITLSRCWLAMSYRYLPLEQSQLNASREALLANRTWLTNDLNNIYITSGRTMAVR